MARLTTDVDVAILKLQRLYGNDYVARLIHI